YDGVPLVLNSVFVLFCRTTSKDYSHLIEVFKSIEDNIRNTNFRDFPASFRVVFLFPGYLPPSIRLKEFDSSDTFQLRVVLLALILKCNPFTISVKSRVRILICRPVLKNPMSTL